MPRVYVSVKLDSGLFQKKQRKDERKPEKAGHDYQEFVV